MAAVADRSNLHIALGAVAGAIAWTATEYATHRWVLHGPFGKGRLKHLPLGGLHRAHHRAPDATSFAAPLRRSCGRRRRRCSSLDRPEHGSPLLLWPVQRAAAFAAGYSTYEINHWNAHHRPARTQWGERVRERHHRHHFGAPASNLGVTIGFWDQVFGTEAPLQVAA